MPNYLDPHLIPILSSDTRSLSSPRHKRQIILRTLTPVLLTMGLVLAAFFGVFFPMLEERIVDQKQEMLRSLGQTVWQLVSEYEQRARTGEFSRQEAQRRAQARIRNLRYGPQGKDYFWINDMHPTMLMHPYRPDLEGKDVTNFVDANNKAFFLEFIAIAEKNNEGFSEYMWQWQDDPNRIVPKLSYIVRFRPWNWVIGTGIYLEDMRQQIRESQRAGLTWFAAIFGSVFLLSTYIVYRGIQSEQQRAATEEALRSSRRNLAEILDSLPDATFVIDRDGYIIAWNRAIEKMTGLPASAMLGKGHHEYSLPFYGTRRQLLCNLVVSGDPGLESRYENLRREENILIGECYSPLLGEHGRYLLGSAAAIHDANGNITGAIESIRDITEKKNAEDNLRRSEENLRITLNSIGDAVIATDADGRIARMNPVAEHLTGWRLQEAFGRPLPDVFHCTSLEDGQPSPDPVGRVLATGETIAMATRSVLIARDQTPRQIADSAAPIRDRSARIVGVVLVFRDISEQVHMEEQFRQSQKMEAIGQLAGGVAHDFNNMLGGIMGAAEILAGKLEGQENCRKYINLILETSERAGELTDQLLSFSRKRKSVYETVDLHGIIEDTLALLERSIDRRIRIQPNLTAARPFVQGDPAQLQSAILNLGINARDAMPEGGVISVSTDEVELDLAYCASSPFELHPGTYIRVSVRDTGVGIAPEIRERIFEPFFTTKEVGKGTGLGLAAVFGTVKDHRGAINVYSELQTGTVFHLYFPVDANRAAGPRHTGEPFQGKGCILLADDERAIRSTAADMLQEMGYRVLVASDGAECLETFRAHAGEIDLAILDTIMPQLSGKETFLALRRLCPDLRIVMASGFSRSANQEEFPQQDERSGFINKPYLRVELERVLKQMMQP